MQFPSWLSFLTHIPLPCLSLGRQPLGTFLVYHLPEASFYYMTDPHERMAARPKPAQPETPLEEGSGTGWGYLWAEEIHLQKEPDWKSGEKQVLRRQVCLWGPQTPCPRLLPLGHMVLSSGVLSLSFPKN